MPVNPPPPHTHFEGWQKRISMSFKSAWAIELRDLVSEKHHVEAMERP